MKRPSFQFYPSDFIIDPGLSTLDYFHIGVYIKLLCFASQAGGELRYREGGEPLTITDLSVLLGLESNKCEKTIDTLLKHGCLKKRDDDGCLYNSRMVKDCKEAQEYHEERKRIAEKGAKARWENSTLQASSKHNQKDASSNASSMLQASVKQCQNDAPSSSTSSSININSHTNAQARAQEEPPLPRNMPTDEQNAVDMCAGIGVPDDFIIQAYNASYAVGFRDRGNAIINWPAYISAYWNRYSNAQKRKEQQKPKQEQKLQYPSDRIEVPTL